MIIEKMFHILNNKVIKPIHKLKVVIQLEHKSILGHYLITWIRKDHAVIKTFMHNKRISPTLRGDHSWDKRYKILTTQARTW